MVFAGTLTVENRVAVLLADVEGYDYVEIAQLLHIPIGTVRSRISRGREKLRLALSQKSRSEPGDLS